MRYLLILLFPVLAFAADAVRINPKIKIYGQKEVAEYIPDKDSFELIEGATKDDLITALKENLKQSNQNLQGCINNLKMTQFQGQQPLQQQLHGQKQEKK